VARTRRISWDALRLGQALAIVALFVWAGASFPGAGDEPALETFEAETVDGWCRAHGKRPDLHAVRIDVRFHAEPPLFEPSEGIVVAPVAVDLPGAQRIHGVATRPQSLRTLTTPRVTAVAWEYAGRVHRELAFRAMALVERAPRAAVALPAAPTFAELPADLRGEATARAADTEEHALAKCAAFPAWVASAAGPPRSHTEVIRRLVEAAARRVPEGKQAEDLCADIRGGRFTPHRAQVAAVMGARELGIPCYGFIGAGGGGMHLVGTYLDGKGWIFLDVERPAEGWFTGGAVLVTMAPVLGGFSASAHDFWSPAAGAYAESEWGFAAVSTTRLASSVPAGERTDTTEASVRALTEACR
jgi:hypothetical protein